MAARLPSPSPSPPSSPIGVGIEAPNPTLPDVVRVATRKQHGILNHMIIHRLPQALPPNAESPLLLGIGLVSFTRIITFFESEWTHLIRDVKQTPASARGHDFEIRKWLAELRPAGLLRSERIRADLRHLRDVAGSKVFDVPTAGEEWLFQMRALMRTHPHVLVAFAWVMYMAIFSGGRWIRHELAKAGAGFWTNQPETFYDEKGGQAPLLELPGFTFLSFDGKQDGADIKALFKSRLEKGDVLLTEQEKREIVDVSQQLFDHCIFLVRHLDQMVMRQKILRWTTWIVLSLALMIVLAVMYYYDQYGYLH